MSTKAASQRQLQTLRYISVAAFSPLLQKNAVVSIMGGMKCFNYYGDGVLLSIIARIYNSLTKLRNTRMTSRLILHFARHWRIHTQL